MSIRFRTAVAVGLVVILGGAVESHAQKQKQPKLPPLKVENGRIKSVQRGGKLLVTHGDLGYFVQLQPKCIVGVKGKADLSVLKRGMFIRFDANVDKRGTAEEPVRELTVFTPSEAERTGVADGVVAGQIQSISKAGKFTVKTDLKGNTVKGEIAADATVEISVGGAGALALVKPGDGVEIVGKGYEAKGRTPGRVLADQVTVTLAPREAKTKPKEKE